MSGRSQANFHGLVEAARAIDDGTLSAERLVRDCLARIEDREGVVRAWAALDPERAIAQAQACDASPSGGPLRGLPIGVKDVLDTADLPTQMGSPIYANHQPRGDAACVAMLRAAGAIILGKTVTCEFAGLEPGPTTNPLDPSRTPGGSSSGSAAAVADLMVPAALGTQTVGSILRPASFCGVVGLKPTYGAVPRQGLKFAAESLDTIGVITRSVQDASFLTQVLAGRRPKSIEPLESPPRLALCRTFLWNKTSAETRRCVESVCDLARAAGAEVRELELPSHFGRLSEVRETITDVERSRSLAWEWNAHRDEISARMREVIARGLAVSEEKYRDELRFARNCRVELDELASVYDALIAPCAMGEAPVGLSQTGDTSLPGLWTLLHAPALSLPAARGPNGMPVGVQIVGRRWSGRRVAATALWLERAGIGQGSRA